MSTKLYVGNLPHSTDSHALEVIFSQVGKVESAKVVEDRMTGRSRGFAFVEMSTPEEAARAIELLDGAVIPDYTRYGEGHAGRSMNVREEKRDDRPGRGSVLV